MAQGYERCYGSIENAWFLIVIHMAVSMECFCDHCTWAAQRETAAFGEKMLLFYTAISPFSRRSKVCAICPFRDSVTVGHARVNGLPDYKVQVVV
jgi:hypothetical protein